MKIIFQPIFVIFFTLLVLSFSFSMKKSNWQTEQLRENLNLVKAENKRLLLEEQELAYMEELSALPLTKERIVRNQKWLQAPGEEVLELNGYEYEKQTMPETKIKPLTAWQEWEKLLFSQGW